MLAVCCNRGHICGGDCLDVIEGAIVKLRIPITLTRRLIIEIRFAKVIRLSEAQARGYVLTSCEQAGYEIQTSKAKDAAQ